MKKLIANEIVFDASAKTLDFKNIENFNIKYLYAVINQTSGEIIYSAADNTQNFTAINGTIVTLAYDTTGQNDDDVLLVLYENNDDTALMYTLLNSFLSSMGWMGNARSANDQMRVNVEAMPTTTVAGSLTAVTTVTNLTNMGGQAIDTTIGMNLQNLMFAQCITNNILIS